MRSRTPELKLVDILQNVDAARAFVDGMSFEQFEVDLRTVYAVVRALEIVSEASRALPSELKERHPRVDWQAVAAAGNVYRHEYDKVTAIEIWRTVVEHLPALREIVVSEIARLRNP